MHFVPSYLIQNSTASLSSPVPLRISGLLRIMCIINSFYIGTFKVLLWPVLAGITLIKEAINYRNLLYTTEVVCVFYYISLIKVHKSCIYWKELHLCLCFCRVISFFCFNPEMYGVTKICWLCLLFLLQDFIFLNPYRRWSLFSYWLVWLCVRTPQWVWSCIHFHMCLIELHKIYFMTPNLHF